MTVKQGRVVGSSQRAGEMDGGALLNPSLESKRRQVVGDGWHRGSDLGTGDGEGGTD